MPDAAGAEERTARERWARPGSRHDRVVGLLRVGLPVAIGVLAAFLVMAPLTSAGDVSFVLDKNKVDVASERLKIQAARYRGEDARGRPFTLDAGQAVQKSSAEPVVQIQRLAAGIELSDGPARLEAPRGRYDMDAQAVAVDGPIAFRAANGYRLDTRDATVDLKARTMKSGGPVTGTVPQGRFSADRMSADLESRTVRLDGRARLHYVPAGAR
jgi:lipopolysaccharide export system protein LptC